MASTFSDLKIELIGTGEQVGSWGNTTNVNLGTAIEDAITGSANVTFSSADVTITLTNTNSSQTARNLRLVCTGISGGARNLILGSGCQIDKLYLVQNDLADTVTIKNTTGTGVAILAGKSTFVFNDGTNVVLAESTPVISLTTNVTGTLPVTNGGTGQTSYTNGQLLIGNTTGNTLTKASLTGTANRLTVTDGAGSITLNVDATNANTANKVVARDGSGNFSAGTITASLSGNATTSSSTSGNAATATALQTARTIGGVSFNGTANINLPGVNIAGNQNTTGSSGSSGSTTGNAATATRLQTARTIGGVSFNGTANINLPGVNTAGNQSTSGNAATATKLTTASGSADSFSARAWVRFDGTGSPSVTASGNVSTIGDDGVGTYSVNLSTAMQDANWAMSGSACGSPQGENNTTRVVVSLKTALLSASVVPIFVNLGTQNTIALDSNKVSVIVFR